MFIFSVSNASIFCKLMLLTQIKAYKTQKHPHDWKTHPDTLKSQPVCRLILTEFPHQLLVEPPPIAAPPINALSLSHAQLTHN